MDDSIVESSELRRSKSVSEMKSGEKCDENSSTDRVWLDFILLICEFVDESVKAESSGMVDLVELASFFEGLFFGGVNS